MGWVGPALSAASGFMGMFGSGMTPEQRMAMKYMKQQAERSGQFWDLAKGQQGQVSNYYSPMLSGDKQKAMEAISSDLQPAMRRYESGRQSLFNLAPRSGGAAAMMDPYAKSAMATNMLLGQRNVAADKMFQLAGQTGGWAAGNQGGATSLFNAGQDVYKNRSDAGGSFFDSLEQLANNIPWDKWFPKKKGGGNSTMTHVPTEHD